MGAPDLFARSARSTESDYSRLSADAFLPTPAVPDPLDHTVALSLGRSRTDIRPTTKTMTVRDLVTRWSRPDTGRGKLTAAEYHALNKNDPAQKHQRDAEKDGEYFVAGRFAGDGRRRNENITDLCGFVLDFDSGKTTRETIETKLRGTVFVAYTSFSHHPGAERWRVFIPYATPVGKDRHETVFAHFDALFEGDLDPSCKKPAQLYYTPACPHDAVAEYQVFHADGALLDPLAIPAARSPTAADPALESIAAPATDAERERELDRLADALKHLEADDRKRWIDVGMAIKHSLGEAGLPTWIDWSKTSEKFDPADAIRQWQSLEPRSGPDAITLGSVYHWAKQAGWTPSDDDAIEPEILEMNERYFVAPYGNKTPIFREINDPETNYPAVEPMKPAELQAWLAPNKVWDGKKMVPLLRYWMEHPQRRQYEGVVFSPGEEKPGYYNLWRGLAVEPKSGSWRRMREHLFAIVCRRRRNQYRYLLNWMAFAVQSPGRAAEVAVVLKGGRGSGKGLIAKQLGALFGPYFKAISNPRHLTGNFNSHLQSCVLLFVDEGHWAGDKAGEGVLKQLITEPLITFERKFYDATMGRNCLHVIIASNNDWVVPAGPDERRFFVLDVDDSRQQDAAYFDPIFTEMDSGGREAMLYDLLKRDLSRFNIRKPPASKALGEQKLQSMDPHHKWWMDKLVAGELLGSSLYPSVDHAWGPIPRVELHEDFVRELRKIGVSRRSSQTELGALLPKLLPPGFPKTNRRTVPGSTSRSAEYEFPPLQDCRDHFEELMRLKGKIDWNAGKIID